MIIIIAHHHSAYSLKTSKLSSSASRGVPSSPGPRKSRTSLPVVLQKELLMPKLLKTLFEEPSIRISWLPKIRYISSQRMACLPTAARYTRPLVSEISQPRPCCLLLGTKGAQETQAMWQPLTVLRSTTRGLWPSTGWCRLRGKAFSQRKISCVRFMVRPISFSRVSVRQILQSSNQFKTSPEKNLVARCTRYQGTLYECQEFRLALIFAFKDDISCSIIRFFSVSYLFLAFYIIISLSFWLIWILILSISLLSWKIS